MFRYRLHSPDGDDLGEATYAQMIYPGEEIIGGNARKHYRSRQPEFAPSLSPIPATLRTGAQTGAHDTRRLPTWLEQAA